MQAAKQLAPTVGVSAACEALGMPRSTYYSRKKPPTSTMIRPKKAPRALTRDEEERVLETLTSYRFMDMSVRQVYATLLDEGVYLCSPSTMYRLLRARRMVRERRNQRTHPPYAKPQLVATAPNQVWTWDITRLAGPRTGINYALYVVLDLYSRYVVAWAVAPTESATFAERFLRKAFVKHGIQPHSVTLHSDRGTAMTSKKVSRLLAELGISKSFSRPRTSNDNPYSESQFKTLKYWPEFPSRFGTMEDAISFCRRFFHWYNDEHYHTGLGLLTPAQVHHNRAKEVINRRNQVLAAAYTRHPERFVRQQPRAAEPADEVWINHPGEEAIAISPSTIDPAV